MFGCEENKADPCIIIKQTFVDPEVRIERSEDSGNRSDVHSDTLRT